MSGRKPRMNSAISVFLTGGSGCASRAARCARAVLRQQVLQRDEQPRPEARARVGRGAGRGGRSGAARSRGVRGAHGRGALRRGRAGRARGAPPGARRRLRTGEPRGGSAARTPPSQATETARYAPAAGRNSKVSMPEVSHRPPRPSVGRRSAPRPAVWRGRASTTATAPTRRATTRRR